MNDLFPQKLSHSFSFLHCGIKRLVLHKCEHGPRSPYPHAGPDRTERDAHSFFIDLIIRNGTAFVGNICFYFYSTIVGFITNCCPKLKFDRSIVAFRPADKTSKDRNRFRAQLMSALIWNPSLDFQCFCFPTVFPKHKIP